MELHLKKNAAAEIMFAMVDSTTPASLKSLVSPVDTPYYRDGAGAWTLLAITDTATEIGTTGMYTIEMTAAEVNHDLIMIKMAVAGAADTVIIIRTFTNNIDSTLAANVTQIGGVTQSATDLKDLADTGYDPVTHKVQGVVLADTVTTLTGHTPQTGDSFARLGAPAGANVSADILVIDNFVDDLETRLTAIRAGYLDNLSAGAVALEATLTAMKQKVAGAFDRETDSLEALRDRGDAAWITATGFATAAVCTEARLAELGAANLPADIDNLKNTIKLRNATINDIAPTTLVFDTTLTEATNNYWNNGAILFTSGANSGVIRAIKDYDGTAKEITLNTALPVAPSNGDAFSIIIARAFKLAGLEMQEIRDAMKLAPSAGAPVAGSVDLHLDDIEADTDDIGVAGAGLTALGDARLANLNATISTRATPAQVNAEVVDVLTVDTIAEMAQGAPPSAPTMQQIINYLYRMWRNKVETTATSLKLYDDAGITVLTKSTLSDDAVTFTKAEYVTGL